MPTAEPIASAPVKKLAGLQSNIWPRADELKQFYGAIEIGPDGLPTDRWIARQTQRINVPFTLRIAHDPDKTIRALRCSRRVTASLHRIFSALQEYCDRDPELIKLEELDLFGGCFLPGANTGSKLHPHAWGAAIRLGEKEPCMAIIQAFKAESWVQDAKSNLFAAIR